MDTNSLNAHNFDSHDSEHFAMQESIQSAPSQHKCIPVRTSYSSGMAGDSHKPKTLTITADSSIATVKSQLCAWMGLSMPAKYQLALQGRVIANESLTALQSGVLPYSQITLIDAHNSGTLLLGGMKNQKDEDETDDTF